MLEVKALYKSYNGFLAVEGVSFSVPKGICFGLLGPNGAGKSTTIAILAGTTDPDRGEVLWEGVHVRMNEFEVKRRIGYVPQDLAIYEELSARANLQFFGRIYGMSGATLRDRVEYSLELTGLKERSKSSVKTFSGGMKRRLNMGISLLHDPDLLILDEPTVGVDPQSRNQIFESLEQLIQLGKTIVYTTHYMEEVERLCERAAIMDSGKIIAEGTVDELHQLAPSRCVVSFDLEGPLSSAIPDSRYRVLNHGQPSIEYEAADLAKEIPAALQTITEHGAKLRGLHTQRASLEEVFLHLTGKQLRD